MFVLPSDRAISPFRNDFDPPPPASLPKFLTLLRPSCVHIHYTYMSAIVETTFGHLSRTCFANHKK